MTFGRLPRVTTLRAWSLKPAPRRGLRAFSCLDGYDPAGTWRLKSGAGPGFGICSVALSLWTIAEV
jgi:hypothetical protein